MPLETGTVIEDLDKSWPLGGDPTNKGDDHLRLIKSVLQTQFPGAVGNGFATVITATEQEINWLGGLTGNVQDQIDALSARIDALEGTLSAPTGTAMVFYQAAAPTGWTQSNLSNRMLRTVDGAGGGSGGTDSPILNDKIPVHNHTGSTGTAGNHRHGIASANAQNSGTANRLWNVTANTTYNTDFAGDHTHTVTVNNNTGSKAGNWEPRYIDVIVATKD